MMDISYLSRNRQKQLFWALGLLTYLPLIVKLLIWLMGGNDIDFPLAMVDVDVLLVMFLIITSLGTTIYLFYLVAGPFLATRHSLMGRRPRPTREWFDSRPRNASSRIVRRPDSASRSVDVIKPSETPKTPLVAHCEFCDAKTYMPYQCKFCNGVFCDDHRLPEKHRCPYV